MNIPKQDYSPAPVIPGVEIIDLKVHKDDGGSFREVVKISSTTVLETDPGAWGPHGGTVPVPSMRISVGQKTLGFWKQVQVNASELEPGVIKAYHYHPDQWDLWYVQDKILVSLIDFTLLESFAEAWESYPKQYMKEVYVKHFDAFCRDKGLTNRPLSMRFVLEDQLLLIPPKVAHGICNPYNNTRRMTYFVSEFFGTGEQEGRIPWNVLGDEVWALSKG